jgi:outer membrane murein-binding lipoprotein Lpp
MRKIFTLCSVSILSLYLAGCSDTLADIKHAASGIDDAADKAATAISQDVHSIRAIEISYNDQTFTVNDLFKSILRDVQWHYEPSLDKTSFKVTGTWQPDLFADYGMKASNKNDLALYGKVTIVLGVEKHAIQESDTSVTLLYRGETLLAETGQEILHYLYDYYTAK